MENKQTVFTISTPYHMERVVWHKDSGDDAHRTDAILQLAEEVPLALTYNGIDYAVMMITPHDVTDFASGFSITEGIVKSFPEIKKISITAMPNGLKADIRISAEALRTVLARSRRPIAGRTGCGICGADMDSVLNRAQQTVRGYTPEFDAIRCALTSLRDHQTLNVGIGMLHAAAWCNKDGKIISIREDVGRHNALDKLIGYGLANDLDFKDGFCLLTSRCSYEMAAKAVAAGMGALVSLSAPTALALRTAQQAGLVLISPAKPDHICIPASSTQHSGNTVQGGNNSCMAQS